jgi:hypothetical protein
VPVRSRRAACWIFLAYQLQPWRVDPVHLRASVCATGACRRLPSVRLCAQKSVSCEDYGSLPIPEFMNLFGHSGQAAVTTIAVQFPYAISYGEFSWQSKSVRAVAKTFNPITKSQIRLTVRHPRAKRFGDKAGIERSKKLIQTIGKTKAGLSKPGLNVIQTIGASIANQSQALVTKPSPAQLEPL